MSLFKNSSSSITQTLAALTPCPSPNGEGGRWLIQGTPKIGVRETYTKLINIFFDYSL